MAKSKIMLVEDNRSEAQRTSEFLEQCGYEVIWTESGTSALKIAKTGKVDCILLDILLPDINGTEVCRWLKGNHDTRGIPIIMLTVKDSVEDKVTGLKLGADDYLPKPYSEMELHARVFALLRNKGLQDELRNKNQELRKMLERVEVLAITDPLTELYNRRRIEVIMETEFARTKRYASPLACMMLDIDGFKSINDQYGHRAGDHVLRALAQVIARNVREVDSAARWGGEEFVVVMPETTKQDALVPANRILQQSSQRTYPGLPAGRVTVSIGIAGIPEAEIDSGERLIDAADVAMYAAKHKGRNRIELA